MKTILLNFLSVLRRFRLATSLNIVGLSVGFVTFIILMMQVSYELRFDSCHPKAERIFRLDLSATNKTWIVSSRPFIDVFLASSPHIEEGSLLYPFAGEIYFVTDSHDKETGFREKVMTCYPSFTKIFGFEMMEGSASCLADPEKILIPASLAHKLFGEASAIGKGLRTEEGIYTKRRSDLVVGGVYKDFPDNTQLENVIYTAIHPEHALQEWKNQQYVCYILLDSSESADQVVKNFEQNFDYTLMGWNEMPAYRLTPLPATYFDQQSGMDGASRTGDRKITDLFILIAFLIVVIAAINFTNLSISLTPLRIRSINTQKVLGSSVRVLRFSLVMEAVGICVLAFMVALFGVYALREIGWLSFVKADMELLHHIPLLVGTGILAIVEYFAVPVSVNFLSVMNIALLEGRDATETDEQNGEVYLFNKKAQELYGIKPNDRVKGFWGERPVIGISDNIALTSLRGEMPPLAFVYGLEGWALPYSYIKMQAGINLHDAVEHIRKSIVEIDPSYPFELEFYDRVLDHLYKKEQDLSKIITLFSLLTVLISIVGIFGLVLFDSQCRRKEIGIRKVYGASVGEILVMFNRSYVRLVVVSFVLAIPMAYYGVSKWLESFAYKTPVYWWVFVIAFLMIAIITLFTVTYQNWKTATENPVESIKTE